MCLNWALHTSHFLYHKQQLNITYRQQQLHFMHYHNVLQYKVLNIKTVIILSWICMSSIKHTVCCLTHTLWHISLINRHWGKNPAVHTQNTDPSWLYLPKHHCLVLNMDEQAQQNANRDTCHAVDITSKHQWPYCQVCT